MLIDWLYKVLGKRDLLQAQRFAQASQQQELTVPSLVACVRYKKTDSDSLVRLLDLQEITLTIGERIAVATAVLAEVSDDQK